MTALYQLKIVLSGSKPLVWRRIVVYNSTSLSQLHEILQLTMGWYNQHTWSFEFEAGTYGQESDQLSLQGFVNEINESFQYIYDFGDHWQHKVTLEKIITKGQTTLPPYCLDGENACPPEDTGGIWGYAELLEAFEDDLHPQHQNALNQLGEDFDSSQFDLSEVNEALS